MLRIFEHARETMASRFDPQPVSVGQQPISIAPAKSVSETSVIYFKLTHYVCQGGAKAS
jgi:hypothetical protein